MVFRILREVSRELENAPQELKENIYGVFERLQRGENIPMPLCRPLFSIGKGLYELRFSSRAGEYRVFYFVQVKTAITVILAMKKKTQKIESKTVHLLRARIKDLK